MQQPQRQFSKRLLAWYDKHGRTQLPWRKSISAYRVWLSEIMLQQTQVTTVIPYFKRFIAHYPNIKRLAAAPIDDVLKLWAGLGYYARARNLHKCAKHIVTNKGGRFPRDLQTLQDLPGIGRSTAGAIAAIAFKRKAPILDGNVRRVLCRRHAINKWPGETETQKQLWQFAEMYLPEQRIDDYTQALMDLGATICTRSRPNCPQCPVRTGCQSHQQGLTGIIPVAKPKRHLPIKSVAMLMLINRQGQILLERRPPVGIWGGLWSLPEMELLHDNTPPRLDGHDYKIKQTKIWQGFRHTFSHYHLDITPIEYHIETKATHIMDAPNQVWYNVTDALANQGLPAPIRRLLTQLGDKYDAENILQEIK